MRAQDIRGDYAEWRALVNGPHDYAALLEVRGIGPARAALLMRVFGSIDRFLEAESDAVANRTRGLVGPQRARTLQERCRDAGLRSDWTRLERLAADGGGAEFRSTRRWGLGELERGWSMLVHWLSRWQEARSADARSLVHRHADRRGRPADQEIG